jgi:hypothetical protein
VPGTAPVAKRRGVYVAAKILAALLGKTTTLFRYWAWSCLNFQRGAQLITGPVVLPPEAIAPASTAVARAVRDAA